MNQASAIMPKHKLIQLAQFQNLKLYPKRQEKCRKSQTRAKKTISKENEWEWCPLIGQEHSNQWRSALSNPSGTVKMGAMIRTAPQETEERIGELIYKEKDNGMREKTKRFIQSWKQTGKEDFINTGFYLRFKVQESQQKLEENKMIIPFRGTQKEKKAYQEMLKEELEEGIVIPIQQDQVKWWNHTFFIKKSNGTWRKILDASKLNKEIEKLHFKMHRLEEVQHHANQVDFATSLDHKSAFHHITVSPNSIPYLAFYFNNNNYAYRAMTFGTKRSPVFFAEAIESILRQIRIHSEIKILNYCDDILLIHQDKQILKTQTIEIMRTLKQMNIESEGNQYKNVGGKKVENDASIEILVQHNIKELKRENKIASSADRQTELPETPDKRSVSISNRIRQSENTSVEDRIMGWNNDSKQDSNQRIEMVDKENRGKPTIITDQQNNSMQANNRLISTGLGSNTDLRKQIDLILHDCWNKKEVEMTSNAKEIKATYYGLLRFEQVFKKMQDQAILIRSDNTTAVYDIGKWKAKESLIERIK
ncbi:MAG: hypothetical protein EZS28_025452, partial [Streblomastix strix]